LHVSVGFEASDPSFGIGSTAMAIMLLDIGRKGNSVIVLFLVLVVGRIFVVTSRGHDSVGFYVVGYHCLFLDYLLVLLLI